MIPAAELVMITEPPPAATRCGAATITVFQVPVTLTLWSYSNSSGVTRSHIAGTQIPALATTTSRRPSSAIAPSTADLSPPMSRMSTCADTIRRSSFSTSATVSARSSGVEDGYGTFRSAQTSTATMSAPSSASRTACARPWPRAPR